MAEGLIALLITVIVAALICGLIVFLIRRAPFIEEPFKTYAEYLVIVLFVLIVIVRALPLLGVSV